MSVKSSWIECVDAIIKLERRIAADQSALIRCYKEKLEYEKELLKNDDGVTAEEKHAYLVGLYYDPENYPKYSYPKPETRKLRDELLKLEKDSREEKRKQLADELSNFSDEFVIKLLNLLKS